MFHASVAAQTLSSPFSKRNKGMRESGKWDYNIGVAEVFEQGPLSAC